MSIDMFPDSAIEYLLRPTLTVTRGLPASGKTTWAKRYATDFNALRSNRDDLRASLFGGEGILSRDNEDLITKVQRATVIEALKTGRNVVIDDMHLRPKYLKVWNEIANEHGANFEIQEFKTPLDDCISFDTIRGVEGGRWLGEEVIRSIAAKQLTKDGDFLKYTRIEPVFFRKVSNDPKLKPTYLVDIDGTLTTGPHERGPFDWAKVGQDRPRRAVVGLVGTLLETGAHVTFMSGRDSVCRDETIAWLMTELVTEADDWSLFMRPKGDQRKDSIVKHELFTNHILGRYFVRAVLDDRDQVVSMWRKIGLTCLQVDYGDF